jgi:hypothetical protein
MPPFEFFRLTSDMAVNKLFLRDFAQAWYHRGLRNISHDVPSTAAYLQSQIARLNVNRTVFVGNSMGGYAAILFGWLVGVDEVHAFAPQTFISRTLRLAYWDRRGRAIYRDMRRTPGLKGDYFDLKRVLLAEPRRTVLHLHFAKGHRLDRVHCQRLAGLPNVVLHPYDSESHRLIKQLRDDGRLKSILCDALTPQVSVRRAAG